ncbi:hypothetical protein TNIN_333461 [Trichonephila inaurata madagascariensis]|uniref:Uncharacterized protein n=1 Tax=Trichonephila inaurata madagascariensis TaxID=2747483 RepID=A0A8X6WN54_9ARAC|nr:hypothetical protein TNIN_333461 [Trichonephila inaurata madagascariensis]
MASEGCYKLLIHSAKQIVQVVKNGERVVVGKALNNVAVLEKEENSSGLSIVVSRPPFFSFFLRQIHGPRKTTPILKKGFSGEKICPSIGRMSFDAFRNFLESSSSQVASNE